MKTDVLVVGGGGREHAICRALRRCDRVGAIWCAPGNAGIGLEERTFCVGVSATDIDGLVRVALEKGVGFVVVGQDDPLALGAVDAFNAAGVRAFGPTKAAARLESSKGFSKYLMKKHGIPTARFGAFDDINEAVDYINGLPDGKVVVKADGLALGKGVVICENKGEAVEAVNDMMTGGKFGAAGSSVVIEEFLTGREVTVLAFCDGTKAVPMIAARDHKRAYDGGKGPNTGGMGVIAPVPDYTAETAVIVQRDIIDKTVAALIAEGIDYRGVIYFGLMLTADGAKVIEYNARFGDPEAQAVLSLFEGDLLTVMEQCEEGRLDPAEVRFADGAAAAVMLASGGYPAAYAKGFEITGVGEAERLGAAVLHSGTAVAGGKLVTNGGRVLGVVGTAGDIDGALSAAYRGVGAIRFEGMEYRTDIGK